MKKTVICMIAAAISLFFCLAAHAEEPDNAYTALFQKDSVIEIRIQMDDRDLKDMYAYPKNEEFHCADVTVAGIEMKNAGVRTKGNSSLSTVASADSDRYSFKIKFNKYVKGQKLLGLNELCLNNGYADPSYMREYLHYELLRRMGQKVPETVFCNLYINGEPKGLYLAVEAIDGSFLDCTFPGRQGGNLYKMDRGASLLYREDEKYSYAERKSGKDTERAGLCHFIKTLNSGDKQAIESVLDVDSALIYIAANTVLCNYDSYNSLRMCNYYLYENDDGVFTVLAWDLNMSFGVSKSNTSVKIDSPIISGGMDNFPLIGKLLAIEEYKERYHGYIRDMMAWLEHFEERVNTVKAVILPYVENDPTAFYSVDTFLQATSLEEYEVTTEAPLKQTALSRNTGVSIVKIMADRLENLKAQFSGTFEDTGKPMLGSDRKTGADTKAEENEKAKEEQPVKKEEEQQKAKEPVIRVHVNGHILSFGADPFLQDGTTLVGFRAILEALGAEVSWDAEQRRVTAAKEDTVIELTIGSTVAYVNGEAVSLLAAPAIINDSTMIPVRFISEALGMKVSWNGNTKLITVNSK